MSKYEINSDFKKLEKTKLPFYPIVLPVLNKLMERNNNKLPLPDQVKVTKKQIDGYKGDKISIRIFEPKDIGDNDRCLIYFHGGAFALKEAPYHINLCIDYALQTPCKVVFVDYRLLPKNHFPVGLEDGYAACKWVYNHADTLGINRNKIAVGGDSVGGALAAGVTLMARDRDDLKFCFQLLIYPVTDARQNTESINKYTDTPMWNSKLNKKMWDLYLKDSVDGKKEYASPMEATSFTNLPNAYVDVAEFDCLRDEGINYTEALQNSDVPVELNITKGTVHGYDMVETSQIVLENKARRIRALQKGFDHI
ncbi:alpha/beta hydrolase [Paenibacillus anaericanus]|uniref:Alpha/beta hydrolase n=1 Tax=Paenibacillus anaericanus TaxID=170367 RepID=A0A3S1DH09_9BACL|nr:alpha/beta hydrolase [Paenibacillus anaericanus]RUT44649.1 alpha/beta hydrolase [Paenibacillus anaericanus]